VESLGYSDVQVAGVSYDLRIFKISKNDESLFFPIILFKFPTSENYLEGMSYTYDGLVIGGRSFPTSDKPTLIIYNQVNAEFEFGPQELPVDSYLALWDAVSKENEDKVATEIKNMLIGAGLD